MAMLHENEKALSGNVDLSSTSNGIDEVSTIIKILRGEIRCSWDGKWVYSNKRCLCRPEDITKYDLDE